MTTLDPARCITRAARIVYSRFGSYVEQEDLIQLGWEWVLSHPKRVAERTEGPHGVNRLTFDLVEAMEYSARKEKAQRLGYQVEDEAYYPAAWLEAVYQYIVEGGQPRAENGGGPSNTDPAERGDWETSVLDIQRALRTLTEYQVTLLRWRWAEGRSVEEISRLTGMEYDTAKRACRHAARALVDALGGVRPKDCGPGCEHFAHDPRLRVRSGRTEE